MGGWLVCVGISTSRPTYPHTPATLPLVASGGVAGGFDPGPTFNNPAVVIASRIGFGGTFAILLIGNSFRGLSQTWRFGFWQKEIEFLAREFCFRFQRLETNS